MSYDLGDPPPLTLSQAYPLAMSHLGAATNRFYCVTASCLEITNFGNTGWLFSFSNTNRQRGRVMVFFDKEVEIDDILTK